MMNIKDRAIVSERGTITIPEQIREIAHIHTGDIIEFSPRKNRIILRHLIVRPPEEKTFISDNDWGKFDKLVQKQLKKGQYTSYTDLDKAKAHSRKLMARN